MGAIRKMLSIEVMSRGILGMLFPVSAADEQVVWPEEDIGTMGSGLSGVGEEVNAPGKSGKGAEEPPTNSPLEGFSRICGKPRGVR